VFLLGYINELLERQKRRGEVGGEKSKNRES
jgi:hypothetical protein